MKDISEYSVTKTTVECYKIRHPSGMYWADITVDGKDRQVRIQIASDYGDYQYYWGACGPGYKQFLQKIGIDYAASKFGANRWFDHDKTINRYKRDLLEYRRNSDITADEAREAYDAIKELEDDGYCNNDQVFLERAMSNDALVKVFDYEGLASVVYDITPQFRKFWDTAWQVFLNELKAETVSVNA